MDFTSYMPRWMTGSALVAGLCGLCAAAGMYYLQAHQPIDTEQSYSTTSRQEIGVLTWTVRDCDSGAILSHGSRAVVASDVTIVASSDSRLKKRLPIDSGFYLDLPDSSADPGEQISGFGIQASRERHNDFSWEWFEVDTDSHAWKIQESGDLGFDVVDVDGRKEVARMEFLSNVSLRIFRFGFFNTWRNRPTWRVEIEKGSYIRWPFLKDGSVVVN